MNASQLLPQTTISPDIYLSRHEKIFQIKAVSGNSDLKKPKRLEDVFESNIYKEICDAGKKLDLLPGDVARISSWGVKDGCPVLIDAGLTKNIFEKYYESS